MGSALTPFFEPGTPELAQHFPRFLRHQAISTVARMASVGSATGFAMSALFIDPQRHQIACRFQRALHPLTVGGQPQRGNVTLVVTGHSFRVGQSF
jgi:hypothetical protein